MGDMYLTGQNGRPVQLARVKRGGWTKAKRARFLTVLAATCNVTAATEAAGMRGKSAYDLRKSDPGFALLWQEALTLGYETLENALLGQALQSVNAIEVVPAADVDPLGGPAIADPDAPADQDAPGHAAPGCGLPRAPVSIARLQFALSLLNRQRSAVEGGRRFKGRRRATPEETDALLRKVLDGVAKRSARAKA